MVGSCTSHPGVLGSIPKREEPGKTGAPCVKVPGSSRVPPIPLQPREQVCNRYCSNKHPHKGAQTRRSEPWDWTCLRREFSQIASLMPGFFRTAFCLAFDFFDWVVVRDWHTRQHIVTHASARTSSHMSFTVPPLPPPAHSCIIGLAVINTHTACISSQV